MKPLALRLSNTHNNKSWTESQDEASPERRAAADCETDKYVPVLHKHTRKNKHKLKMVTETHTVNSTSSADSFVCDVQDNSSFVTTFGAAAELSISQSCCGKQKKKKHKSKKQSLSAESDMHNSDLETHRSDYTIDFDCLEVSSIERNTEFNRSKDHRRKKNKQKHKSKKRTRPTEFDVQSSADIDDNSDCTGSEFINTPQGAARCSQSAGQSLNQKEKLHKLQEKTQVTECQTNAKVNNSNNWKTADMSYSLETLKETNRHTNRARKKEKKSRVKTQTEPAECEASVDLISSDTYTGFSQNAITEDRSGPRKKRHKSKSQSDVETANVSINKKPKNCESEKRSSTDSETQDSTSIGEVDKSRNLTDGDLSLLDNLQVSTEVNIFENNKREKIKKNRLSLKKIHLCEVSKLRDQSDCEHVNTLEMATEVSAYTNPVRGKKRKHKSGKETVTAYCETKVKASSLNDCTDEPQTGIALNTTENEFMTESHFVTKTSPSDVNEQPSVQSSSGVKKDSESAASSDNEDNVINVGQDYTGSLSCYLCSEKQANGIWYIYHLAKQHCIKAYLCPYCSASMSSSEQLKQHLKFSCRRSSVLIRPHRCKLCPAKFTHINLLKKHVKAVHENKPDLYPCSHCRRTFTDPKNAKAHRAKCREGLASTEEKTKTKECPQCGKMFSSVQSLYCHRKTIHGKAVFQCVCGQSFLGSRYFYAHGKVCSFRDSAEMDC